MREQHKGKVIIIAGDDDHRLETNPGRTKALEAAAAIKGVAIFPQLSAEQKQRGMTDFNDLASQNPEIVASQFQQVLACTDRQGVYASKHVIKRNHAQSRAITRNPSSWIEISKWRIRLGLNALTNAL